MDENSCVDETSKSVENAVKELKRNNSENTHELEKVGIAIGGKANQNKVLNRCGSSCDASGPSSGILTSEIPKSESSENTEPNADDKPVEPSPPREEDESANTESPPSGENESANTESPPEAVEERVLDQPSAPVQENSDGSLIVPNYENSQLRVRIDPSITKQPRKLSLGPPPSYSFVMRQKKKVKLIPSPDPSVINRPPPPNYTNTRGLFIAHQESRMERFCNLLFVNAVATNLPKFSILKALLGALSCLMQILLANGSAFWHLTKYQTGLTSHQEKLTHTISSENFLMVLIYFLCLASFVEPAWRAHSQPALCPRCGVIVLTTTHSHDSLATHLAALALCLFGCWLCCLLPYCMNVCKNTYHYCPICQAYLGLYTPW